MKKIIMAVLAVSSLFTITSCTNDSLTSTGNGSLKLEFDNVYGEADLALNTEYTNSNGEKVKPNNVIYIISNIVLTKTDGTTYTVPKSNSYFFVNESDQASTLITLPSIPAGDYTKVTFGIGADKAQYDAGADGQGNLWTTASLPSLGMTWSWATGYKFVKFEGTVTSASHTDSPYKVHTGKTGDVYNYAEAVLTLPNNALVRSSITPQIHIMADVKKIIDGTTVINFEEGLDVMGGAKVQQIMANNVPSMFEAHHVHND